MSLLDIALVAVAYLVGAIPFGLVVARLFGSADLRSQGSGNIGATNATRVLGRKAGVITLAADVFKGVLPVGLAVALAANPLVPLAAASAAVLGHTFPVYLGFRGGKGVATGFGVVAVLDLTTALLAVAIWLLAAKLSRVSAVGALAAYVSLPVLAWFIGPGQPFFFFTCGLSLLVLVRHASNIRQLLGTA